jgi:hypothetical protein
MIRGGLPIELWKSCHVIESGGVVMIGAGRCIVDVVFQVFTLTPNIPNRLIALFARLCITGHSSTTGNFRVVSIIHSATCETGVYDD